MAASARLLADRHVLVTGAARGIGRAVADACERNGAAVVRTDLDVSDRITVCDVRSEHDVIAVFEREGRRLTDVIHCAGIAASAPIEDVSTDMWRRIVETNLTGSFLIGREFARTACGPGTLTFIGSAGGLTGTATYTAYNASKFGVVGLARCLALELAPRRIRVNAVCPGGVRTPMVDQTIADESLRTGVPEPEIRRRENDAVPLGRMAEPEEVASVCVFLASDLAAHVSGVALLVDGAQLA